jgi:energy-coupling factor transporter ATP-binding protein EcfA2
MSDRLQITSVHFSNYKAYRDYTVPLDAFNMLVGPNNAGKSTIIGSLRILSEGLRRARARSSDRVEGPDGTEVPGYPIKLEKLPVSTENVFHNYDNSSPATVTFQLSNGNTLLLFFAAAGECVLIPCGARHIRTPTDFKREFNLQVAFVPVLGPVEHNETLHEKDTARNALLSHSASRNFRNIWYHFPDGFDAFQKMVQTTWPGMDILPPELTMRDSKAILCMFCPEHRIIREIFWAGFGFQVWCQMLTFVVQARNASLLIVDEPDIYLHADLQRQLVGILKNLGPDIIVATHSVEMISEVEPHALLHINKQFPEARRLQQTTPLHDLSAVLGPQLNPTLAQLAKTRRVVFIESRDFQILFRLARVLGLEILANRSDFAVIPVPGHTPEEVEKLASQLEETLGLVLLKTAVFFRGLRNDSEARSLLHTLERFCTFAAVLPGADLESLLPCPDAIQRAVLQRQEESRRTGAPPPAAQADIPALLEEIYASLKKDGSTRPMQAVHVTDFASDLRAGVVSGRELLSLLNRELKGLRLPGVSSPTLAKSLLPAELWPETVSALQMLETARLTPPKDGPP